MTDEEKMLWDLFCMTGEPQYYSMYALKKAPRSEVENNKENK